MIMKKIIVNLEYCNVLQCMFARLRHAALSYNDFKNIDHKMHSNALQTGKARIENSKNARNTMCWVPADCVKRLKEDFYDTKSFIEKLPLPWHLMEYYKYVEAEVEKFEEDVKLLNSKDNNFTGKIYGSKD